jgi:SAM-dependent methyltransferase
MQMIHHVNVSIFYLAVVLLCWNLSILIFNRAVPNIPTAPAIRRAVIALLKEDMARQQEKRPYTIIDIGAGNGQFTREIAAALPDARVIGLEISWFAYRWSLAMKRRHKLENLEYRHVDFFTYDMKDASAVVMFFFGLERTARKLRQELEPGTLVTSTSFRLLDGWQPAKEIDIKSLHPFQKKLYVYYSPSPGEAPAVRPSSASSDVQLYSA